MFLEIKSEIWRMWCNMLFEEMKEGKVKTGRAGMGKGRRSGIRRDEPALLFALLTMPTPHTLLSISRYHIYVTFMLFNAHSLHIHIHLNSSKQGNLPFLAIKRRDELAPFNIMGLLLSVFMLIISVFSVDISS